MSPVHIENYTQIQLFDHVLSIFFLRHDGGFQQLANFNASCLRASIHDDKSAQIKNGIAGRSRPNRTNKDQIGDTQERSRLLACMYEN